MTDKASVERNSRERKAESLNQLGRKHFGKQRDLERDILETLDIWRNGMNASVQETLDVLVKALQEHRRQSEEAYAAALDIWRHLSQENPSEYGGGLAEALTGLALLHVRMRRETEAEETIARDLKSQREQTDAPCDEYALAMEHGIRVFARAWKTERGLEHLQTKGLAETARELSEALAARRRLAEPLRDGHDQDLAEELEKLARALKAAGQTEDARRFIREAAAEYKALAQRTGDKAFLKLWRSAKLRGMWMALSQ